MLPDQIRDVFRYAVKRKWTKALELIRAHKTEAAFELHVWNYMRDYFESGNVGAFIDAMAGEIDNQWWRAWREGAALAEVTPDDFTEEDDIIIESQINQEIEYVMGLAEDIDEAIAEGLTDKEFSDRFAHRPPMWANRYNAIVDEARMHFGKKGEKFIWELGPTEEHCTTETGKGIGCLDLAGIVMFNSEWEQAGIMPQSELLACNGLRCGCRLNQTNARRTPGALTRVLDMMTGVNL